MLFLMMVMAVPGTMVMTVNFGSLMVVVRHDAVGQRK